MDNEYSQYPRKEKINLLKQDSVSIFYKDFTKYTDDDLNIMFYTMYESKKLELKSVLRKWLSKRVIDLGLKERVIKEDYIPILVSFQRHIKDISEVEKFNSINDIGRMLEDKYGESVKVKEQDFGIFFEFGDWFVAMPQTEEASIALGRQTVWCTAYTTSTNLFKEYVSKDNTILFYLINIKGNPKKNPYDKLCVCFKDGKPDFTNDGRTVNSLNTWLTEERFYVTFGEKLAQELIIKMTEEANRFNNKHPIQIKTERLATDVEEFKKEWEKVGMFDAIYKIKLSKICSKKVISFIIDNKKEETYILENFLDWMAAPECAGDIIFEEIINYSKLGKHIDQNYVKIMENIKLSQKNQDRLLQMIDKDQKRNNFAFLSFYSNPYISRETVHRVIKSLDTVTDDSDRNINLFTKKITGLASNRSVSQNVLMYLHKNYSEIADESLAKNDNLSKQLFNILSSQENDNILEDLAKRKNLPSDVLKRLSTSIFDKARIEIAKRNDVPEEIFKKFIKDKSFHVVFETLNNLNFPEKLQIAVFDSAINKLNRNIRMLVSSGNLSKVVIERILNSNNIEHIMSFAQFSEHAEIYKERLIEKNNIDIIRGLVSNFHVQPNTLIEILRKYKKLQSLLLSEMKENGLIGTIVQEFILKEGEENAKLYLMHEKMLSTDDLQLLMKEDGEVGLAAKVAYEKRINK